MPSCVVKWCHNSTNINNKTQGITFHRFPSANETWKNDWIQIIRKSRKQNCWNPSKSSVICSIHFEDNDLYTTKGGLCRVRLYGVPKKFLIEPTASEYEKCSSRSLFTDLSPCEAKPSTSKQQALCSPKLVKEITSTSGQESFSQGQAGFKGTTSPSLQLVEMIPTSGQQVLKDTGSLSTISFHPLLSTEQHNFRELSIEINSSNGTSEVLHTSAAITTNLEESLTVLYSPRKRRLKKTIIKMKNEMENKNKKIKLLNQKVRRLKNRNESLKDVLKTLKEQNYVGNDMDNFIKYKLVGGKRKLKKGLVPHKFACQERSVEEPERSAVKMLNIEETHIKVEYIPQDQDNDPLEDVTRGENLSSTTVTEDSLKMKHKEIQVNLTDKVYLNKSTETEDKYFHVTSMD